MAAALAGAHPVVAVVGRPNVGKSTLVNRVLRRREAVVEDVPGVTRDRVSYDAEWAGRRFTLVDTGGWEIDATGIHLRVAEQAEVAIELADAVLFVVDSKVGATDDDEAVVKLLRRSGKPVVLVANKVDDQRGESDAAALWNLGLGQPWPVSALHGRGSGDALDALLDVLPEKSAVAPAGPGDGLRRVALVGRPNVGKSSLLNKLVGSERVVVDSVAGTTRDPVDEVIDLGGRSWRFVDTAGIRRRVHQTRGADFYASLRTQTAIEKAEVAVVLIDAEESIAEQDLRVISQVVEAGRALVIAYNKWDLTDEERRKVVQVAVEAVGDRGALLPAHQRAAGHHEVAVADGDDVAVGQLRARHPPAVDEGSVDAAEVLDHEGSPAAGHLCVVPRRQDVADDDVVVGRASDPLDSAERDRLALGRCRRAGQAVDRRHVLLQRLQMRRAQDFLRHRVHSVLSPARCVGGHLAGGRDGRAREPRRART